MLLFLALHWSMAFVAQPWHGLVARYTFNGDNGKNDVTQTFAKLYNVVPVEDRFGNSNSAYYLHGNPDSYINIGANQELKNRAGTISLWAKIDHITTKGIGVEYAPLIFTRSDTAADFNEAYYIGIDINTRCIGTCQALSERDEVSVYSTYQFNEREWNHVAITYDNRFYCLYINGSLEAKAVKNFASSFLSGDSIILGNRIARKNKRSFNGTLDDIEIYNRALNPKEIISLYNAPNPNRTGIIIEWTLIGCAIALLVIIIVWIIKIYVTRIVQKEKEKNMLKIQWIEQENKVIQAQMNPHFIFNSLNTIQQFIISNDNKKAQLYLSKFARLIRKMLESSTKDKISLKEEIALCEKYLEIESLRFNHVFNYAIDLKNNIDASSIYIPHFLIQAFIENAIWHGLLPKKGEKELRISFEVINEHTLSCVIDDNGVGRKKPEHVKIKSYKKSLAINFIRQRLLLYSKIGDVKYGVNITDKVNTSGDSDGTHILLTIPILN